MSDTTISEASNTSRNGGWLDLPQICDSLMISIKSHSHEKETLLEQKYRTVSISCLPSATVLRHLASGLQGHFLKCSLETSSGRQEYIYIYKNIYRETNFKLLYIKNANKWQHQQAPFILCIWNVRHESWSVAWV